MVRLPEEIVTIRRLRQEEAAGGITARHEEAAGGMAVRRPTGEADGMTDRPRAVGEDLRRHRLRVIRTADAAMFCLRSLYLLLSLQLFI